MITPALKALIVVAGISGYRCENTGKPGFVNWYDGGRPVFRIYVPGPIGAEPKMPFLADNSGPTYKWGAESRLAAPLRINSPSFKADEGIKCTLSFPMM